MRMFKTHQHILNFETVKNLVKSMDGLSDEGFDNKYINDPCFNKGINCLVALLPEKINNAIYGEKEQTMKLEQVSGIDPRD